MPIPLRESSSVVLTSERNQLIYEIQFKYIGNFSINKKSYDVLWTCITTEVKVWNNSALKRIKWMKCSRNKMIRNKCNIFLVDWGIDKNKNRKPQAIQCRYQSFFGWFMQFMSCDSCHVIHVMWFLSCDSFHEIHFMGFISWDSCLVFVWSEDSEEETTQSRMSHSQQEDSWADDSISLGPEGKRKVPVYSRTSYRAMSVTLCSFVQAWFLKVNKGFDLK